MSDVEWQQWRWYYNRHPFDDAHRYHRPALARTMIHGGLTVQETLDWLDDGVPAAPMTPEEADANTLRAFGLQRPKGK